MTRRDEHIIYVEIPEPVRIHAPLVLALAALLWGILDLWSPGRQLQWAAWAAQLPGSLTYGWHAALYLLLFGGAVTLLTRPLAELRATRAAVLLGCWLALLFPSFFFEVAQPTTIAPLLVAMMGCLVATTGFVLNWQREQLAGWVRGIGVVCLVVLTMLLGVLVVPPIFFPTRSLTHAMEAWPPTVRHTAPNDPVQILIERRPEAAVRHIERLVRTSPGDVPWSEHFSNLARDLANQSLPFENREQLVGQLVDTYSESLRASGGEGKAVQVMNAKEFLEVLPGGNAYRQRLATALFGKDDVDTSKLGSAWQALIHEMRQHGATTVHFRLSASQPLNPPLRFLQRQVQTSLTKLFQPQLFDLEILERDPARGKPWLIHLTVRTSPELALLECRDSSGRRSKAASPVEAELLVYGHGSALLHRQAWSTRTVAEEGNIELEGPPTPPCHLLREKPKQPPEPKLVVEFIAPELFQGPTRLPPS